MLLVQYVGRHYSCHNLPYISMTNAKMYIIGALLFGLKCRIYEENPSYRVRSNNEN